MGYINLQTSYEEQKDDNGETSKKWHYKETIILNIAINILIIILIKIDTRKPN